MPYDDEGFTPREIAEIITDYEDEAGDLFDENDFSPSAILWQQMKVHALDSLYYETLLDTAADQMSIQNAEGIFLDKHGIECGIDRRGATHAQGYVDATTSNVPFVVAAGTTFRSSTNDYTSDEETTIPEYIQLTKGANGEGYDYFPSDLPYAQGVDEIQDGNSNVIDTSHWTFDTTYNNNIYWVDSSTGVLIKDETYTVYFSGSVTKKIEVSSVSSGISSNAPVSGVTSCVEYPSLNVTNSEAIDGGADQESHDVYRTRLLNARRRNFTLDKVRSIAEDIDGVRSAKVYQNKGTDQTSVADWDTTGTLGANVLLDQYPPKYSQKFVPGNEVVSLGRIVLQGRAVGNPPAIRCGVKSDVDSTGIAYYFDNAVATFEEEDLDPGETGFQDIKIDLKYNGLDKTKTYRFDLWLKQPETGLTGIDFGTHYWELRTSTEAYGGSSSRYDFLEHNGSEWVSMGTGTDLKFKTQFNGAAYTVLLAPEDGFGFTNLSDSLDAKLDYIDGGGLSPIGIQYSIVEPDEIDIDIRGTIYITELADFQDVREQIIDNIETYLESLKAGDNVVYSRIEYEIMRHPNVWKEKNLEIKRSDLTTWKTDDVYIDEDEIADLGTRSFQRGI